MSYRMLRAVIVDDEAKSRRILSKLLEDYCPDVTVVGMAENVTRALEVVHETKPNLVFLDIEMPQESGFVFIDSFEDLDFEIVFTTAYEQYALKAFQAAAVGYLLKPIVIDELKRIVEIIKSYLSNDQQNDKFGVIKNLNDPSSPDKVVLPIQYGMAYLELDKICFINSQGRKSLVNLQDGTKELVTFNLKKCLEILEEESFIRIHKSYLINIRKVSRYVKGKDSHILLECGSRIDIGQNYKQRFQEALTFFAK